MPYVPPRRIQVTVPKVQGPLRIFGYDPEQPLSVQIEQSLRHYADLIQRASIEVEAILNEREWNLIADVLNGCLDLMLYSESPISASRLITADVEDGHRLDRVGDKWFGDDDGDLYVGKLLAKIRGLSELQCEAILAAVRHFWQTDEAPKDWWRIKYRMPERRTK